MAYILSKQTGVERRAKYKPLIYRRRLQCQRYGTRKKGVPGDLAQRRPVVLTEYYFVGLRA